MRLPYDASDLAFTRSLAKVELHAHLNGSVRRSTLAELALARRRADAPPSSASQQAAAAAATTTNADADDLLASSQIHPGDERETSSMFSVFDLAHACLRGATIVRRVAREVLEDFAQDGVVYAEIRTTPRAHREEGLSDEGYVEAVLDGFRDHAEGATAPLLGCSSSPSDAPGGCKDRGRRSSRARCHARLILSIDRRDGEAVAQRTVDLALRYRSRGVVGVDLSGDPTKGTWSSWSAALHRARTLGLKVTVHAGEVAGRDEETGSILDFAPDRLGHVWHLSTENQRRIQEAKDQDRIPLELCLTSNLLACPAVVPEYSAHHFALYHQRGHPVVLCTDDTAVFGSVLSQEYAIAMKSFNLSRNDISTLARQAVQAVFLDRSEVDLWRELERVVGEAM